MDLNTTMTPYLNTVSVWCGSCEPVVNPRATKGDTQGASPLAAPVRLLKNTGAGCSHSVSQYIRHFLVE